MIEIRLLEHAVALAEHGSFALAAQAVGLSQSALSRSIQTLETQLGVPLFDRSHRRIEPTDAGNIFLARAREMIAEGGRLLDEMGSARQHQAATFNLAAGPYPAESIMAPALAEMLRAHPELQFRLRVENWVDAVKLVRAREAELCVADITQVEDDPDLIVEPLGTAQGFFVVREGHPLVGEESFSLERVLRYPLVSTSRLPPRILAPLQKQRGANQSGLLPLPAVVCEQISIIRQILARSDAVGMLVRTMIEPELRAGTLKLLRGDVPWLRTNFGVIRLRNRPLPLAGNRLIACLRDAAAKWIEEERRAAAE